jgi:putative cell wall-binding protein
VADDTNHASDIFVRDRNAGGTERVSISTTGEQADGDCYASSISSDGSCVVFGSDAGNLVTGDNNGLSDVFLRDRAAGTTERVSVGSSGAEVHGSSGSPDGMAISANNRYVAFGSRADELVSGDTNGVNDVFLRDRVDGTTERVSVDTTGAQGNDDSYNPSMSADGRYVTFETSATNLLAADTNGNWDVFLRDLGPSTPATVTFDSVEGTSRLDTAVEASKRAYPASGTADTIVLATGWNWPDALGGSALAGAYDGPLLLTKPDALSQQVLDEAARLNVFSVVILGSEAAVSAAVESSLTAASVNGHSLAVTRIGGAGRYDTAARIASATVAVLASKGRAYEKVAFFATGGNFPDALAASPIAARKGWPILLVQPDAPGTFTEDAIASLDVTRGIMLGSDRAVSAAVETRLTALLPAAPTRLSGASRYDTGIAVASFGATEGLSWDGVAIATGTNFPDALAGGVMQGKLGSVVLLTPGDALNPAVAATLTANRSSISTVRYLGSTLALSQGVRNAVAVALR